MKHNYYFTFGTASHFPFPSDQFLLIKANTMSDATEIFRSHYPDHFPDTINCAFIYTEDEWKTVSHYYKQGPILTYDEDVPEKLPVITANINIELFVNEENQQCIYMNRENDTGEEYHNVNLSQIGTYLNRFIQDLQYQEELSNDDYEEDLE